MNRDALPLEFWAALLAIWVVGAGFAIGAYDTSAAALLGAVLLGLILAAGFARPFRGAAAVAGLVAIVLYAGATFAQEFFVGVGISLNRFAFIFGFVLAVVVTVLLINALMARILGIYEDQRKDAQLIEELTIRDTTTGAIKRRFADQILLEEIQRARRFARVLTLGILSIEGLDRIIEDQGQAAANEILNQAGQTIVTTLRTIDKVSRHNKAEFAMILTETKLDGAQIISERLVNTLNTQLGITCRVGLAEFPSDAATVEDLVRQSQQALDFARAVSLKVASRNLLEGDLTRA